MQYDFHTDKVGHGYIPTYLDLARRIGPSGAICEVGIATGDSMRMWRTLFPDGVWVGVDINPAIVDMADGWHTIVSHQDQADLVHKVAEIEPAYDMIVDDASHDTSLTRETFKILWPLVKPGYWYVIEDWSHCNGMMADLAAELLGCLAENVPDGKPRDVESIHYRPGMIILAKKMQ